MGKVEHGTENLIASSARPTVVKFVARTPVIAVVIEEAIFLID